MTDTNAILLENPTDEPDANIYQLAIQPGRFGSINLCVKVNDEAVIQIGTLHNKGQALLLARAVRQEAQKIMLEAIQKAATVSAVEGIHTAFRIVKDMPEYVKQGAMVRINGIMRIVKREDAEAFAELLRLRLKELKVPGIE